MSFHRGILHVQFFNLNPVLNTQATMPRHTARKPTVMAMLVPTLMRDPPIYDSLRERTLERERTRLMQEERVASGLTRERE